MFQIASSLATLHDSLQTAYPSLCDGDGLFDSHLIRHAPARFLLHPHLQLEDDQRHGLLHVHPLLHLRGRVPRLRVRLVRVSNLKTMMSEKYQSGADNKMNFIPPKMMMKKNEEKREEKI